MAVHSTASSELQMELLPRLSRNIPRCCEKGLSATGVGFSNFETNLLVSAASARPSACVGEVFGTISDSVTLRTCLVYCRTFGRTAKSALTAEVAEHGTTADQRVRRDGCKPIPFTSYVLPRLVFLSQQGTHEGFVKYVLQFRSKGKRSE